jgi:hypothetical protein
VEINDAYDDVIDLKWVNNKTVAHLSNKTYTFTIDYIERNYTQNEFKTTNESC